MNDIRDLVDDISDLGHDISDLVHGISDLVYGISDLAQDTRVQGARHWQGLLWTSHAPQDLIDGGPDSS